MVSQLGGALVMCDELGVAPHGMAGIFFRRRPKSQKTRASDVDLEPAAVHEGTFADGPAVRAPKLQAPLKSFHFGVLLTPTHQLEPSWQLTTLPDGGGRVWRQGYHAGWPDVLGYRVVFFSAL
jgi:hypothetical protein